jgi:hypothetical protein
LVGELLKWELFGIGSCTSSDDCTTTARSNGLNSFSSDKAALVALLFYGIWV